MPYEYYAMKSIVGLVPNGTSILDVGANIGNHSLFWAASGHRVVAFEPNPAALVWLKQNKARNEFGDWIDVRPFGLGAASGRAIVVPLSAGNLGKTSTELSDTGTVEIHTLDSLQLPDEIGAIKIDVEGGEADVLRGALGTLHRHKPVIMIELWNKQAVVIANNLLRPLGYRQLPFIIGGGPTYLFLPGWRKLLSALRSGSTLWAGIRVKVSRGRRWLRTYASRS